MPRRSLARSLAVRFVCHKWSAHSRVRHVVDRATVLFICMDGVGGGGEGGSISMIDNLVPRFLSYSSLRSEREKVTDNPGIKRESDGSMLPFTRSSISLTRKNLSSSPFTP